MARKRLGRLERLKLKQAKLADKVAYYRNREGLPSVDDLGSCFNASGKLIPARLALKGGGSGMLSPISLMSASHSVGCYGAHSQGSGVGKRKKPQKTPNTKQRFSEQPRGVKSKPNDHLMRSIGTRKGKTVYVKVGIG